MVKSSTGFIITHITIYQGLVMQSGRVWNFKVKNVGALCEQMIKIDIKQMDCMYFNVLLK